MLHTHTPGQSRVNPERQEEEKSGHTTGRRPKTAQGGKGNRRTSGTNLHGETDLTKTAHTPKPHDTLRRGTRGKLGTKWGTSWWQTRKPKQLVKQQDSAPKPRSRALSHSRHVVNSCPSWHKRLSSSNELGAQYVSPHRKPKRPHLQEKDMPVACCRTCHVELQNSSCSDKNEVSGSSERLRAAEKHFHRISRDCRSSGTSVKNRREPQGQLFQFT